MNGLTGIISNKKTNMQELISLIREKSGITEEQARQAVAAVREYVVGKFPMLAGAVDKLFEEN